MNTKLSMEDTKAIEKDVMAQLTKVLPKVVKSVVQGKLVDLANEEAGIVVQNGVKQPTANEPAYIVWKAFDGLQAKEIVPTPLTARKIAHELKQASNVVIVDLYLWRKFHGIAK